VDAAHTASGNPAPVTGEHDRSHFGAGRRRWLCPTSTPRAVIRRIPLSRVTAIELRKMFDTRSGFWLMASIVIAAVLAATAAVIASPPTTS
jgi:hypothetical protein